MISTMDAGQKHIEETFLATLNPATTKAAESHLHELATQPGFLVTLMQLLSHPNASSPVLQAGAAYFKNHIYRYWESLEKGSGRYEIPDNEKQVVRTNIVDLVCKAPMRIKNLLAVTFARIINYDFPDLMCDDTVQQIGVHLQSADIGAVIGALMCFYAITQKYEYKNVDRGRATYQRLIPSAFPYLLNMAKIASAMDTVEKAFCLKMIVKIFFATIHYELDDILCNDPSFAEWVSVCVDVLGRPVLDLEDHTGKNPATHAKKWAAQALYQLFHRYGIPKLAPEEHKKFAENFQKVYAAKITEVAIMLLLHKDPGADFVGGPRVIKACINILEAAVNTSKTWKVVKPHFLDLLGRAIFPVLCHSEADEELWEDDQQEFIKRALDPIEEFNSTDKAAQVFLMEVTAKRKDTLMAILNFCNSVFTEYNSMPPEQRDPRRKDGVLVILGTLATLIEKKLAGSLEQLLVTHVFPEFQSPHGFMRFRSCWMLERFNDVDFTSDQVILAATDFVLSCLKDPDLPVRVMGAIAIQHITRYPIAKERMAPHLLPVMQELITLTNMAEVDDLADVMQELVARYGTDLGSVAAEMTAQLTQTFVRLMQGVANSEGDEDINKTMVAMGILKTICTIVSIFVDNPQKLADIESQIYPAIDLILQGDHQDCLEDAIDVLVTISFVRKSISPQLWTYFPILYNLFSGEYFDYFDEMMPAFDNYVSFGTQHFLSDPQYMIATVGMLKRVMEDEDSGEFSQVKACQLAESVLLFCRGHIGQYIPDIVRVMLPRLMADTETTHLKLLLVEVLAECILNDTVATLMAMEALNGTPHFFNVWFELLNKGTYKRAHDLHVMIASLCEILSAPEQQLPAAVQAGLPYVLPALLSMFKQLPDAYKRRKDTLDYLEAEQNGELSDLDSDDEPEVDTLDLGDDDDYADEEGDEYLNSLVGKVKAANPDASDDSEYEDDDEDDDDYLDDEDVVVETAIDTSDMYVMVRDTFQGTRGRPIQSFQTLAASLAPEHQQQLMQICQMATQREQAGTLGPQ